MHNTCSNITFELHEYDDDVDDVDDDNDDDIDDDEHSIVYFFAIMEVVLLVDGNKLLIDCLKKIPPDTPPLTIDDRSIKQVNGTSLFGVMI